MRNRARISLAEVKSNGTREGVANPYRGQIANSAPPRPPSECCEAGAKEVLCDTGLYAKPHLLEIAPVRDADYDPIRTMVRWADAVGFLTLR
jgi:hypothetical protein